MSSAIAMNRKIASQGGRQIEEQKSNLQQGGVVGGTPIQQQWQVLNYHETRLNKMDGFLVQHSNDNVNTFKNIDNVCGALQLNVKQLEKDLAELKKEMTSLKLSQNKQDVKSSKNNKKGAVQLEIENN